MKKMKKRVFIFSFLLVIAIGCLIIEKSLSPKFIPDGASIPDKGIVYSSDEVNNPDTRIVFANADGNGIETRSIYVPRRLFEFIPIYWNVESVGTTIVWGLDGKTIGVLAPVWGFSGQGYPIIVDQNGKVKYCGDKASIIARYRILPINQSQIMAISISQSTGERKLVIYDMDQCQVKKVLYTPDQGNELTTFSYSNSGMLALQEGVSNTSWVIIEKDGKEIMKIENAYSPAWSKDGQKLAFIDKNGFLCYLPSLNNTESVCLYNSDPTVSLSWSPDGTRITYQNSKREIIIQNIINGDRNVIGQGFWPDWRPIVTK
jgi:hypothetical protein